MAPRAGHTLIGGGVPAQLCPLIRTGNRHGIADETLRPYYRAFSYQFVKTYPVLSRGFELETEMTIPALQRNMQI